jgi:hypothetical protein
VLWQHRPVGQMPGNTRSPVVQHQFAHPAPQAIGADQHIAFDFEAFGGLQGHDPSTVPRTKPASSPAPAAPPRLAEVGCSSKACRSAPVNGGVGGPVEPDRTLAERQYAQLSAGYCIAHLQTMGEKQRPLQGPVPDPCHVEREQHWARSGSPPRLRQIRRRAQTGAHHNPLWREASAAVRPPMPPPAINTRVLMPLDFGFSGGQFPDRSKPAHTGYRGRKQQRQHKAGVCLNGVADGTRTHDDQESQSWDSTN